MHVKKVMSLYINENYIMNGAFNEACPTWEDGRRLETQAMSQLRI